MREQMDDLLSRNHDYFEYLFKCNHTSFIYKIINARKFVENINYYYFRRLII